MMKLQIEIEEESYYKLFKTQMNKRTWAKFLEKELLE